MTILGRIKPAWKVLKNNQLTDWQEYVYCKDEETANAVAARFRREPASIHKYKWVDAAAGSSREHWCVTQSLTWVIAETSEVKMGQWYIGIWSLLTTAEEILCAIYNGKDYVDDYRAGVGPVSDKGYVIVATSCVENPAEIWCYRNQIIAGDSFEYLEEPGQPYYATDRLGDYLNDMPGNWLVSTSATAKDSKLWNAKVKRIPRWNDRGGRRGQPEPRILPCVDPLGDLRHAIFTLLNQDVDGIRGAECLRRFEQAQRTESIARTTVDPPRFVSTNAECGLTVEQVEHARDIWRLALKLSVLESAADDATKARASVCDDFDELPNMVYVP